MSLEAEVTTGAEVGKSGRFGVASMTAPLQRVAMRRPGRATVEADPALWHYTGPLDADRLLRQYDAFLEHVTGSGAEIEWLPEAADGLADSIFVFDPSFMTPGGAILLRPGKALRRAEVALHDELYRRLGVPVIRRIEPPGLAEGGTCSGSTKRTLAAALVPHPIKPDRSAARHPGATRGVTLRTFDLPVWNAHATPACISSR